MKKQTAEQAELVRDARAQGISVARVEYGDPRAPQHWCVARSRDGSRLSKAFTCESDCWSAVPSILSEMALARETAQREESERLARYAAAAAEKRKNAAKLPEQLQGFKLDNDFPESKALQIAKEYVATFEDKLREGRGLVFVGPDFSKVRLGAGILTAVCEAGWSGRFMDVFQVELALETGRGAIDNPDLLTLCCYEAGPAIREVLKARANKSTILVASCSEQRLVEIIYGYGEIDVVGLDGWQQLTRKNQVIEFPKGGTK